MKNFVIAISLFVCGPLLGQITHTVDNSPNSGAQFTTLQNAIDNASAGDTLYVHPSQTAYGNITLTKLLHFRGMAHSAEIGTNVFADIGTITLNSSFGAEGITLEGLRINQIQVSGSQSYDNAIIKNCRIGVIRVTSTSAQCDNWVVSGNVIGTSGVGIIEKNGHDSWVVINNHIRQAAGAPNWHTLEGFNSSDMLRNNIFVSEQDGGAITFCNLCESAVIENSLMLFNGTSLSIANPLSEVSFNHCLSFNYLGGTAADLNGSDNLNNTNPMFVDAETPNFSYEQDFHIEPGSPAHTHGTDGLELGIYGSSYPFNLRGYPDDLPYPTFMQIENAIIAPGGTLNVSFEAESN